MLPAFAQYEISNFAKPGFESRHNCKYWHCEPYLGIGPSAHSCWNGKRFFVPSSAASFLEQPVQTVETEDGAPCTLEERLMLGLRLTEGVPAAWLAEKKAAVERYCKLGFLRAPETGCIYAEGVSGVEYDIGGAGDYKKSHPQV